MFGKIKGKLKGIFSNSEDVIFEEDSNLSEEEKKDLENNNNSIEKKVDIVEEKKEGESKNSKISEELFEEKEIKQEKKGFFSKIFGKSKEEKEQDELENLEDDMLEGVEPEEKEAIKEKKAFPKTEIKKKELEKEIEQEEVLEKEELVEIQKIPKPEKVKTIENDVVLKSEEIQKNLSKENELIKEEKIPLPEPVVEEPIKTEEKKGFFSKTFGKLASKKISEEDFDKIWLEIEIFLLEINIAYEIVEKIESELRKTIINESFNRFSLTEKIREVMINEVEKVLKLREDDLLKQINEINKKGEIARIVVLGVNGTGKTTTIAKFVNYLQKNNKSLVVAASDTFRAAAVEQLEEHSKKLNFKLIKHHGGSDPAAVAFDAIEHAKAKKLDVVIIDTAGRMPNNSNLMQELAKIERIAKADINLFIGDSISGNDLIEQIELFDKIVGITGMILTKTDTDERPGSIVTAAYSIEKPIYYLGIGQTYDDLIKFDAKLVAEKLFDLDEE